VIVPMLKLLLGVLNDMSFRLLDLMTPSSS
jgi:hypothetical protein